MDAKVTFPFDKEALEKAKKYAKSHNISLSRLSEFQLRQVTTGNYKTLEDLTVSDWVNQMAEGRSEYVNRKHSRRMMKHKFYTSCK